MTFAVRAPWPHDLELVAALIERCQGDLERFCSYPSDAAVDIAGDVARIDDWTSAGRLVLDDERRVVGALMLEIDTDIGRAWWWGPFVDGVDADLVDVVADTLVSACAPLIDSCKEHELAADERSSFVRRFAGRHGFVEQEGSALLRWRAGIGPGVGDGDLGVERLMIVEQAALATLHDELFPNTHTRGAVLAASSDHTVLVARSDGKLVGYVATEVQHDGSLYLDFLGVAASHRGAGLGRRLIAEAIRRGREDGVTTAHLTVRIGNVAARALYASLGFDEERIMVPYRRGFLLD